MTVRATEASERCRLRGSYTLRTGEGALELWGGPEAGTQLYNWPYRFLRRFGRDKVSGDLSKGSREEGQVMRKKGDQGGLYRNRSKGWRRGEY